MAINYKTFVEANKSIIIAPAWYWKTHTISESLKYTEGRQLILTHTHAGIASIKKKLKKSWISNKDYNVETITSFAQKFVLSFYVGDDLPKQEDTKNYYPFLIEKAIELFKLDIIKKIIKNSYNWLFIDEYQDCTDSQHKLTLTLSNILPTHILWDYLQWIFNFNPHVDPIVDLSDKEKLSEFYENHQELKIPWRWKIWWNEQLWLDLQNIREKILGWENINLCDYKSLDFFKTDDDIYSKYRNDIFKIIKDNDSLLFLDPNTTNIHPRIKFIQNFKNCFLIEWIDDKAFYKLAKSLDKFTTSGIYKNIIDFSLKLFNKTEIKKWFNIDTYKLKGKRKEEDKIISTKIKSFLDTLEKKISYTVISELLIFISKIPNIKFYRKDLFFSLLESLKNAEYEWKSVYEAMSDSRNQIRRVWNRIQWRCVWTTLLTKWLEFDTVVLLDVHKFECPKNLYVALTRASKKLIIFSNNNILNPYNL